MIKAGGAYAKRVAISHSASIGCQSVPCCQSKFFEDILGTARVSVFRTFWAL
jgi:hypothetical protein